MCDKGPKEISNVINVFDDFQRDKMQVDKKTLASKLDEDNDERRKEIGLLKAHVQKEREEMRGQVIISLLLSL